MTDSAVATFHWADYLLFFASLVTTAFIGAYFGLRGDKQNSTKSFLLGGGKMHPIPVALSLQASFMSAVQILGNTSEIYLNGTMYSYIVLGYCWCFPVAACVFMPVIHRLKITSAYEYLEKRFDSNVRVMASSIFTFMMIIYLGLALYTPAIALSQVTGLSKWISIMGIGLVCTFYTSIGGMKAVVYTDFVQVIIIYTALLMLIIEGIIEVGGVDRVWEIADEGSRIQMDKFSAHPHERHTFWTQLIGGGTMTLTLYAANQAMIQRYLSMATVKQAQTSIFISLGSTILTQLLLVFLGLVMYAYYYTCDPLTSGKVEKSDQLLIYMMMDSLGHMHGLPGIFTASIFSAALSTVSSGVNALAAVMLVDIIKPAHHKCYKSTLTDAKATVISKLLALGFGLMSIAVAYLAEHLGSRVLQFTLSIFGVVGGPLLGLFINGILLKYVNSLGALIGTLSSLVFTCWVQFGYILRDYSITTLPLRTDGCSAAPSPNATQSSMVMTSPAHGIIQEVTTPGTDGLDNLYIISYMWYSVCAVIVNIGTASVVSALSGCTTQNPPSDDLLFFKSKRKRQDMELEGDAPGVEDMNSKSNLVPEKSWNSQGQPRSQIYDINSHANGHTNTDM